MAIDYRLPPSIESFSPQGDQVPLDAVIEARVSSDLDRTTLAGSMSVIDPQGQPVPGGLSYHERVLRFVPNQPLKPAAVYTVILHGVFSSGTKGLIQTVVGVSLGNNVTYTFRTIAATVLLAPAIISPADAVELADVAFAWRPVEHAVSYHIQVYHDPSLQALAWESRIAGISAIPDKLPEGQYWWRIAATDLSDVSGPWSTLFTFLYAVQIPGGPTPLPVQRPTFALQAKTVITAPTVLKIQWPYPVTVAMIKLIHEDQSGNETEIPFTDVWTENTLQITPQEVV